MPRVLFSDYPGTGAFKSPALGLSPRASVGRMTPASPYTRAPPAVAARQSQLFIRAQQHIQNHVRFKQPPHEPPPSHHQQASFNNNNKRRSLVEERRRMFELGVSPVAPPPQQRHALATIRPTPAGEGSAMAGNSLTFVPSILRTPRDAQNGPSMPQSGVVSGRGSMLTTPLKTAHFPAAQGHFYSVSWFVHEQSGRISYSSPCIIDVKTEKCVASYETTLLPLDRS